VHFIYDLTRVGGSFAGLIVDLDQARRMLNLRIKIDVWSQGIDKGTRALARDNLMDLFCEQIPLQRLWLFLKHSRFILLSPADDICDDQSDLVMQDYFEGPEDAIVQGTCLLWLLSMLNLLIVLQLTMLSARKS
jgi:hypothetical protein